MLTYNFKIDILDGNGLRDINEVGLVPYFGFSDFLPLNEELDSGTITFLSRQSDTYPIFSYLQIEISDGTDSITKQYYLGMDNVEVVNKMLYSGLSYEHVFSVIEITKKAEKFICEFCCFTQSSDPNVRFYSLKDALHRVFRIFPIGEDDLTNTWDYGDDYDLLPIPNVEDRAFQLIDSDLEELGQDFEIPQLFLDNGTLREKLDEILKSLNGISRLEKYVENSELKTKLTIDLYNELKNLLNDLRIESMSDDVGIEESQCNIETFVENSVNEISQNSAQIIYPNIDGTYDRFKTSEENYNLTDSNCGIRTEYPIYRVDSVIFPIHFATYQGTTLKNQYDIDLEMTNRIIEESTYNSLPLGSHNFSIPRSDVVIPQTQATYIYYKYKSNFIDCGKNHKDIIFTYPNLNTTILCSTLEYILANNYNLTNITNIAITFNTTGVGQIRIDTLPAPYNTPVYVIDTYSNFTPHLYTYRIKYTPIYDNRFSADKNSTSNVKVNATNLENQRSKIMSFEHMSNHILSSTQRLGTQHREIAIRHEKLSDLLHNGDYFQDTNEIITECEYIYYQTYIVGKYSLTKDYNRINEFIGINSEIRQWQIPSDMYERKIIVKNYLEIDDEPINNTSYMTELGMKTAMDNLIKGMYNIAPYVYKASCVFYNTLDTRVQDEWATMFQSVIPDYTTRLLLGCTNNGGGNIISLGFKFQDNMCALPIVVQDNSIGNTSKYLIKKVPYAIPSGDYMGFLRNFNFTISNEKVDAYPSNLLPFCLKSDVNFANDLVIVPDLLVLKDPSEQLSANYQLSCISNNDYITIGRWFSIDNHLIKDYGADTPLNLHVYTSTIRHGKTFNNMVNSDYTDTTHGVSYYFDTNVADANYNYANEPYISIFERQTRLHTLLLNQNIKEIVIADPDTKKIHLVIDVRYFQPTYNNGQVTLGRDTIYFNFLKKRSKINYSY